MGYRERRAHKQQQKQQSLGQSYTPEQRVSLPAPMRANSNSQRQNQPPTDAVRMLNAVYQPSGTRIFHRPWAMTSPKMSGVNGSLVHYDGCGSTSAEIWVFGTEGIWDASTIILSASAGNIGALPTQVSTSTVFTSAGTGVNYDYTQFRKNVIAVNGTNGLRWNRADGWQDWSATASGDDITNMIGVANFKQRIFSWKNKDSVLWYGSTDQLIGTLNPFDLAGVVSGDIRQFFGMPRDFSGGPDELAVIITDIGEVAVYQGTDPADPNNWSLVGTYKIGPPLGQNTHVRFGQQTVVLCTDDFYFLPQDLLGKRQASPGAMSRRSDSSNLNRARAHYWPEKGLLVFSEGSVLNVNDGFSFSEIMLTSADPIYYRTRWVANRDDGSQTTNEVPSIAPYKGKMYSFGRRLDVSASGTHAFAVFEVDSSASSKYAKIITGPIPTTGRTNISLVNPIFTGRRSPYASLTTSTSAGIKYRTAVVYDNVAEEVLTSSDLWVTTSCVNNSYGLWTPGFGTGDWAQIHIELMSAPALNVGVLEEDLILQGIDITVSDTGGI